MQINLKDLAEAFLHSDVQQGYVDTEEGTVVRLAADEAEDAIEHAMRIEEDWERYVPYPDILDEVLHEMMVAFAETQEDGRREELMEILSGHNAVTRFHRAIRGHDEDVWLAFQQEYMMEVARDWCEENDIPCQ